jgi:hypothetical protein
MLCFVQLEAMCYFQTGRYCLMAKKTTETVRLSPQRKMVQFSPGMNEDPLTKWSNDCIMVGLIFGGKS